ncbi:uncharacterized protein V1513DRAFT_427914 [Lipomyces chichibuensis]|uniref:uncharacterized protein n=1 Tax=Lipomyces chichibuensis TaxID=1546026 RepID=UPI003343BB31
MHRKYLERKAARQAAGLGARSRAVTADIIVDEATRISDSDILSENYKVAVLQKTNLPFRELPQFPRSTRIERSCDDFTRGLGGGGALLEESEFTVPFVRQFLEDCAAYLKTKTHQLRHQP